MGKRGSFPFYRLSWQTGEGGLSPNLSKGRNGSWSPFPHLCSGPLISQCVCFPGLSTNVLDPAVPALSLRPQTLRCSNSQKLLRKSVTGFFPHRTFLPVACGTGVLIASQGWLVRTQGAGLGHQGVELGPQGGGARLLRGGAVIKGWSLVIKGRGSVTKGWSSRRKHLPHQAYYSALGAPPESILQFFPKLTGQQA